MAGPLRALTSLYGETADGLYGAGALASQGAPADPSHGQWGDAAGPAWETHPGGAQQGAYDPAWVMVADEPPVEAAGHHPQDRTPDSHAAPYPRLEVPGGQIRDAGEQWRAQEASWRIHAQDLGAPGEVMGFQGGVDHAHWDQRLTVTEGHTLLSEVPGQIKGAGTGKDVAQGFGKRDRFGYFAGHFQQRAQIDPVPGNFQWLEAAETPHIVPRPAVQQSWDGPDSPYGAYGDTTQAMGQSVAGAAVESFPVSYAPPPDPGVAAAYMPAAEAAVIGDGWC